MVCMLLEPFHLDYFILLLYRCFFGCNFNCESTYQNYLCCSEKSNKTFRVLFESSGSHVHIIKKENPCIRQELRNLPPDLQGCASNLALKEQMGSR